MYPRHCLQSNKLFFISRMPCKGNNIRTNRGNNLDNLCSDGKAVFLDQMPSFLWRSGFGSKNRWASLNRGSFFSWKEEVFLVLARENTIPYTTSKMHTTLNNRKFIFLEFLLKLHWVFLSWNCAEELHTTSFILYGSFVYISLRMLKYKVDKRCVI